MHFLIKLVFYLFTSTIIFSCKKDAENVILEKPKPSQYSILGKVQKGPFVIGTEINLYELNANLGQSGNSYLTTISSDDGSFNLNNIELSSNLVLLNANGFYFSELFGNITSTAISLQSIVDLSENSKANINVLTHVSRSRIEKLVSEGHTFQSASTQTKIELLSFLGVTEIFPENFDDFDIIQNNNYNGVLLAFSTILQRYVYSTNWQPPLPAELSQLLANFRNDFADNGNIDNQSIVDTLLYNISLLNCIDIQENIETRYTNLNISYDIPDFKKYIDDFQIKHSDTLYTNIIYPIIAPTFPHETWNNYTNILNSNDSIFSINTYYTVSAIVPINSTLTVKIIDDTPNSCKFNPSSPFSGWKVNIDCANGSNTFTSQRNNNLLTTHFQFYVSGSATIEFYENQDVTPTFTKHITFQ